MSKQCRMVDADGPKVPGDMWYAPKMLDPKHADFYLEHVLSTQYRRDWLGKRPPLFVCLPNGDHFCVDSQVSEPRDGHGWEVTGEPPHITVSPSINAVGGYHGWLQNGVLSDDVEGRQYP
jgi:hypothetical protein